MDQTPLPSESPLNRLIKKTLPNGEVIQFRLGDINNDGEVDKEDLKLLQLLCADNQTSHFILNRLSNEELLACDVNNDGSINQADLAMLCNYIIADLEKESLTDELTGLLNRRGFKNKAFLELQSAKRFKTPLSCICIDIDHFKIINDKHGHDIGDKALCLVSKIISKQIRSSDVINRYGGDEFLILLENANASVAEKQANKIIELINSSPLPLPDGSLNVSVSIGISELCSSLNFYQLLKQSDEALYLAKENGRNQAFIYRKPL